MYIYIYINVYIYLYDQASNMIDSEFYMEQLLKLENS